MTKKKASADMLIPTLVMGLLAVVLLFLGWRGGQGQHLVGHNRGLNRPADILPLPLFAFRGAGLAQGLRPPATRARWVGGESGLRGILIGTVAGGLAPGGPYVSLPIVAGLLRSGAGVGTMVAFLTGWSLWAVSRLPMEFGILGWRFTLIRLASTFFFPPIAGLIAQALFGGHRPV